MNQYEIEAAVESAKVRNLTAVSTLFDRVLLTDYAAFVKTDGERELWGEALQKAIAEHEVVVIPARKKPYDIERQIIIGSDRRIEATGAYIRQTPECKLLMLRNVSTADGTYQPIDGSLPKDRNISIEGGLWEESRVGRAGYGSTGKYDEGRSFYGVSTMFFFNNMSGLTVRNLTFCHTAGFAVQTGDIKDEIFEHITFDECFADGLHLNGNAENVLCRDIHGQVGDDLVALNVYDWQNSSVDFGGMRNVLCEDLLLCESEHHAPKVKSKLYRAMRIEPGRYYYDDGSEVDCSLTNAVIRRVDGIHTFKLYFQTPRYLLGTSPERGGVGSADNVYFEDITVDLEKPIDGMACYTESDPVRGFFGAFELGANIGSLYFNRIDLTLHRDKFPLSYMIVAGPKSSMKDGIEIFDPYLSSHVEKLVMNDIFVNGERAEVSQSELVDCLVKTVVFDDINKDGHSTAKGEIYEMTLNGIPITEKH